MQLVSYNGGLMKKRLRTVKWMVFAFACFASETLSAWYDPTGYWGRHYANYYDIPSRGLYTIRAELLYLRPHVDNLKINEEVIEDANVFDCIPNLVFNFTNDERKRRFTWRPGWKVGLGFACSDCWEADLNWTHYQSRAHLSDFNGADSKWKVQLDMIDLEIGKEMWFRRCFRLKPFAGVRFAQIKQRWRFEVEGNVQTPLTIPPVLFSTGCDTPSCDCPLFPTILSPFELDGVYRHIYLSGGPRIGVDVCWLVGCGFHFYVIGAANYLYGEMQNRYKDNFVLEGIDKDHHWVATGMTDFSFGIGWSDLWWNERRRLTFRFGYEHHFFINQNRLDSEGAVIRANRNWFVQGIGGTMAVDF